MSDTDQLIKQVENDAKAARRRQTALLGECGYVTAGKRSAYLKLRQQVSILEGIASSLRSQG